MTSDLSTVSSMGHPQMSEYTWAWVFATLAAAISVALGLESRDMLFGFALATVIVALFDINARIWR